MRIADTILLSTRMFKTRPLRSFLTILGVSVGIGAVLFLVSLGYGMQRVILSQITTADSLLSLDVTPTGLIPLTDEDIENISKIPEVTEVSPMISLDAQLKFGEFTGTGLVYAVDSAYFRLGGVVLDYGEDVNFDDNNNIIISSASARLFGLESEEMIGKNIALSLFRTLAPENGEEPEEQEIKQDETYKVIGIIEDENNNYAYISMRTLNKEHIKNYAQLKVKVSNNKVMEKVRNQIVEKGFLVSSLSDTIERADKIFRVIQIILAIFGLIALSVSAIGMFNTMTIALLERINEIGIMRAIGISEKDIRELFLIEAIIMGFLGGVGGVVIGFLAGKLANIGINILAKVFGGRALDLFYNPPWFVLLILCFSLLVGFITGIYPSIKASKLNPLEALRYK